MYSERANKSIIESSFTRSFITAILGPRRVGKTILVQQYAQKNPQNDWAFLNMDDLHLRLRVERGELRDLIQESSQKLIGGESKVWAVIDEAQKCPLVFESIKILYDQYKDKDKIKFIITGSSVLSLHQMSAESLAGRIELYHLREFSLQESMSLKEASFPRLSIFDHIGDEDSPKQIEKIIKTLKPFKPSLENALSFQLQWGGFPELFNIETDDGKLTYLNNYIQTYLEKDVRAIETITNLALYRNLMEILASQTGSVREEKAIVDSIKCTRDTLKKYRGFLEATLLYRDIYPYISNPLNRLVKSPKGYLMNNGLISALTGIYQLQVLIKSGLIGHRLENWFLNELSVWLAREPLRSEIFFWRKQTGAEVDFVVEKKPNVTPFEITFNSTIDERKVRNLVNFLKEEPKAKWGFYIYRGDFLIDAEKHICFIPAWAIG